MLLFKKSNHNKFYKICIVPIKEHLYNILFQNVIIRSAIMISTYAYLAIKFNIHQLNSTLFPSSSSSLSRKALEFYVDTKRVIKEAPMPAVHVCTYARKRKGGNKFFRLQDINR